MPQAFKHKRAALVIAHPGHELRVHRWLEMARPLVCVFTDGSGHTGQSRLDSSTRILTQAGGRIGPIYGLFTDARIYAAIRNKDAELFIDLVDTIAEMLVNEEIEYIVGDANEGYNPTHDLCRAVIDASTVIANKDVINPVSNFEFAVVSKTIANEGDKRGDDIFLQLDEGAWARKMAAARSYLELQTDVEGMMDSIGPEVFKIESIRLASQNNDASVTTPFYETYGERQVAAGYYPEVIRYGEHVLPIMEKLARHADRWAPRQTCSK